jgi:hypothetical protein
MKRMADWEPRKYLKQIVTEYLEKENRLDLCLVNARCKRAGHEKRARKRVLNIIEPFPGG